MTATSPVRLAGDQHGTDAPTPAEIWKLAISAAIDIVADQPIERARPVSPLAAIIHKLERLRDRGPQLPGGGA